MKKLMIIAATALICGVVNAASCNWETDVVNTFISPTSISEDEITAAGYCAFFVDNNVFAWEDAQAALAEKDTSFLSTYGKIGTVANGGAYGVVDGYGNNETVEAYAVILNGSTIDKATYAFLSEIGDDKTGKEGQAATPYFDTTASNNGANWYNVAAVPEPTSGLLLLLGVAGLALRRRRA